MEILSAAFSADLKRSILPFDKIPIVSRAVLFFYYFSFQLVSFLFLTLSSRVPAGS